MGSKNRGRGNELGCLAGAVLGMFLFSWLLPKHRTEWHGDEPPSLATRQIAVPAVAALFAGLRGFIDLFGNLSFKSNLKAQRRLGACNHGHCTGCDCDCHSSDERDLGWPL